MFRFNKKKLLLVWAVFSSLFSSLFSASRNITSLKLDFLRSEKAVESENNQIKTQAQSQEKSQAPEPAQNSISGTILYNKNPFLFIFTVTDPVTQTMFVNNNGAFLLDNDTVYDISENKEFLNQTCKDFLNWFKTDYGLAESHFNPTDRWLENSKKGNRIVTQWDCHKMEEQPLDKVLVWSDEYGRFTKLQMFVDSSTLVTETTLENFKTASGFSFPTSIISVSYNEGEPFMTTELTMSNISFNNFLESDYKEKDLFLTTATPPELKKDLSVTQKYNSPDSPAQEVYRVSIPSVLVSGTFKFYKKYITSQDMSNCPFYPSCSQYMLEAVSQNGMLGFFQGIERLKRCTNTEHSRNQYPTLSNGKHYDPVPPKKKN